MFKRKRICLHQYADDSIAHFGGASGIGSCTCVRVSMYILWISSHILGAASIGNGSCARVSMYILCLYYWNTSLGGMDSKEHNVWFSIENGAF